MEVRNLAALPRRPSWILIVVALPLGVLVNGLTGGWANLPGALHLLMGSAIEPTLLQRWIVKTLCSFVIPGVISFAVLKITRLGDWLAPNRLALAALIMGDILLFGHAARSLYMASTGELPFLTGMAGTVFSSILTCCFVVGLGALVVSTTWHRLVRDKALTMAKLGALFREI